MNPWELTWMLIGYGVLGAVAMLFLIFIVAIIVALVQQFRKKPDAKLHIFKSPDNK